MKDNTEPRYDQRVMFEFSNPYSAEQTVIGCRLSGQPVPFCLLAHKEAVQAARWHLIVKDLEFADAQLAYIWKHFSTTLERLLEGDVPPTYDRDDEKGLLMKSIFDSVIVAYGKCFAEAKGRKVKLEADTIFTGKKGRQLVKVHKKAIDIRNGFVAHAGITEFEVCEPYAVLNPTHGPASGTLIAVAHTRWNLPDNKLMTQITELVGFVTKAAKKISQEKINHLTQRINEDPQRFEIPVFKAPK